ncbi:alpha-ketoglutarate decarboxylase [Ulvibacter antarcticus]|uniref:Alpha-ketoglutarate decarboxylase n=1 Tax=Ulvibacter antarcticus TaxID=442714 RepID=A0A3L9Z2N3_9FLAO|nr:alpha-ketoglutarate decarboxylase [Ulvibacter antarcticus]RMA66267.1 hypothetical protein BXY75_0687 [Ulvibacter antarcticus]
MNNLFVDYLKQNTMFILLLLCTTTLYAQEDRSLFWSNVHFGGGIGLSFGDGFFSGTLAPSAIYDFNDQFALGVGLSGTYNSQKNLYSSTILGGSILGLYNIIPQLQVSAEFEELHVSRAYEGFLERPNDDYWYPALFVGVGYRQGNFTIGLRYDLLYDSVKSVYANAYVPFVRVYF